MNREPRWKLCGEFRATHQSAIIDGLHLMSGDSLRHEFTFDNDDQMIAHESVPMEVSDKSLYRVVFQINVPVSSKDYADMVSYGGPITQGGKFTEFNIRVANYQIIEMHSVPLDLERATAMKLRFNGTMTKL